MMERKNWIIFNTCLAVIAVILLFNLIGVDYSALGEAYSHLYPGDPVIYVQSGIIFQECPSLERCCFAAGTSLHHVQIQEIIHDSPVHYLFRSSAKGIAYWMNNKAFQECKQQPFW